jgi:hypothetical protein
MYKCLLRTLAEDPDQNQEWHPISTLNHAQVPVIVETQ